MTDVASGEIHYDPYDYELDVDPYPMWKRMRDEAPVYYNAEYDFFALSRHDDVKAASVDWQTFRSGRGSVLEMIRSPETLEAVRSVLFMDPPEHSQHRALVSRVFTPRRVAQLEDRIRELCVGYLDTHEGKGFDYVADFGAKLPMMVIGSFLGIPVEDQDTVRALTDAMINRAEGETDMDLGAVMTLVQYMGAAAAIRRVVPRDDFITDLINAEMTLDDGTKRPLAEDELLRFLNILAAAGNETVTRLMGWTAVTLARHPDQRRLLVEDPSLIGNAVEELLRYEAPSPVQARWVEHDATYHGQVIPAGSVALLLTGSAGRDERTFDDPDRFDVRRSFDGHLALGYGIHFCLGAALARLEGRVALEETLKRYPEWDVDWSGAVMSRTSTVRGWDHVPIVPA